MSVFLRIDINIAAMVLLGAVFFIARQRLDKLDSMNGKFLSTSLFILLEISLETLTCVINHRPERWLIPVANILHVGLFAIAPALTYSWSLFIASWVLPNGEHKLSRRILLLPVVLNAILAVQSPFTGLVFQIDAANSYHRGPLFLLACAISYFYLIISIVMILRNKKKIIRQEFVPLFIVGILPIFGGLVQTLFYGTLLMWSCSAFSLVIVYIFLQQRMIHLDSLTGAWTRNSFDSYISQRTKQKPDGRIGAIYMDIDGLKKINDKYGHLEGDEAIRTVVRLIKSLLRKTDIVARLGGDEFIIITDCDSKETLDQLMERMVVSLAQHNEHSGKEYRLECSFGMDLYNENYRNFDHFLHTVDTLMYQNKKQKMIS